MKDLGVCLFLVETYESSMYWVEEVLTLKRKYFFENKCWLRDQSCFSKFGVQQGLPCQKFLTIWAGLQSTTLLCDSSRQTSDIGHRKWTPDMGHRTSDTGH